jgi:hypothetical protein
VLSPQEPELLYPWYRRGWWLVTGVGPRMPTRKKCTIRYLYVSPKVVSVMHTVSAAAARSLFQDSEPTGYSPFLLLGIIESLVRLSKSSNLHAAEAVLSLANSFTDSARKLQVHHGQSVSDVRERYTRSLSITMIPAKVGNGMHTIPQTR